MNFKTTLLLLVVLAVAGAYVVYDHWQAPATTENTSGNGPGGAAAGRKLVDLDARDITCVKIHQPHDSDVVLWRQDGKWTLTVPLQAAADQPAVEGLVSDLAGLRSTREMAAAGASADAGLDSPRFRVELDTASGKSVHLTVGDKTAMRDAAYARLEGDDKIDLIPTSIWDSLNRKADEWRQRQVFPVNSMDVRQLSITRDGVTMSLRKVGNDWDIRTPRAMPGDTDQIQQLLNTLTAVRAEEFLKPNEPRVKLAQFDKPLMTIFFSTEAPATLPATAPASGYTLVIGHYQDVSHEKLYARRPDQPEVMTILATTVDALKKTPLDLRRREVLKIDPGQVSKVSLVTERIPLGTTRPDAKAQRQELLIVRRKQAVEASTAGLQAPSSRPATHPASAPAIAATQAAPTGPVTPWEIISGPHGYADKGRVDLLLGRFSPMTASAFLEKSPTTRPSDVKVKYIVKFTTEGPGGTPVNDYELTIVDRGPELNPVVSYQGLIFEVDHSMLADLEGDFAAK